MDIAGPLKVEFKKSLLNYNFEIREGGFVSPLFHVSRFPWSGETPNKHLVVLLSKIPDFLIEDNQSRSS